MIDALSIAGVAAVCIGMLYLASRIEPHWAAKDGSRFMCSGQELDDGGRPLGRRREVRVRIEPGDPVLRIRRRSMTNPSAGLWKLASREPDPPKRKVVYLLDRAEGSTDLAPRLGPRRRRQALGPHVEAPRLALRLPAKSSMIPILDELVASGRADAAGGEAASA